MSPVDAPHSPRKFYAHTAEDSDGNPDPDGSKWQPLADHERNAAAFAKPFGVENDTDIVEPSSLDVFLCPPWPRFPPDSSERIDFVGRSSVNRFFNSQLRR